MNVAAINTRAIPFNTTTPEGVVMTLPRPAKTGALNVQTKVSALPPGKRGFMLWLRSAQGFPQVYNNLRVVSPQLVNATLAGLADIAPADLPAYQLPTFEISNPGVPSLSVADDSATESWISTVKNAASAVLQVNQQRQVMDMQLQRARAGLPPLDVSAYTDAAAYQVGLNQSTQRTLLIGAGILVGGFVLYKLLGTKRGRR
jgi:hypothetical protein